MENFERPYDFDRIDLATALSRMLSFRKYFFESLSLARYFLFFVCFGELAFFDRGDLERLNDLGSKSISSQYCASSFMFSLCLWLYIREGPAD